ncbi:tetratricopeptide repeat protein, partial [Pseudorhodoplanes sp.]|uniref:tetratricopeptide repeat protein n=1 Tax=Pseudorhodoplanes sp. TaxID=1934341 RepID=UPI003D0A5711
LAGCGQVIASPAFDDAARSVAHTNIGELRTQAGALKEAIYHFGRAIRLDGDNARAYAGRAEAQAASGNSDAAIQDYDKAIAIAPSDSTNFVGRGHAHFVRGDSDAAIRDLTEALRLQPGSAVAFNNRGLAYRKKRDLAAALADYDAAIALNPVYALAYANRGRLLDSQGRKDDAIRDLSLSLQLDPSQASVRAALKRLGAIGPAERESDARVRAGRLLVETNCAPCHATGSRGASPNARAPAFRELQRRYDMLSLRTPITRGLAAPHDEMPRFRPTPDELDAIVAYINGLSPTR